MQSTKTETDCPDCYGTGQLPIMRPVDPTHRRKLAPVFCDKCGGTGRIESTTLPR
jgi:DnaJ-class molecular chaperone